MNTLISTVKLKALLAVMLNSELALCTGKLVTIVLVSTKVLIEKSFMLDKRI